MDRIIDLLYLGDLGDIYPDVLDRFGIDVVICVLEKPACQGTERNDGRDWVHIPILVKVETEAELYDNQDSGEHAETNALDSVADTIENAIAAGKTVLVHCGAGLERSPLAVAWYLRRQRHITISEAYALIMPSRHVYERTYWLPPEFREW